MSDEWWDIPEIQLPDNVTPFIRKEPEARQPDQPVGGLKLTQGFDFTIADIPPRPWIVPGLIMRQAITLLVGTGGAGKSLFSLQLAASIASGQDFGGFKTRSEARIMVLNAEDDLVEQRRRLAAMEIQGRISRDAVGDRLIVVDDPPSLLMTYKDPQKGIEVASPLVNALVEIIKANQVDVLIVDPFTETLLGDENSSEGVRTVMRLWRDEIARECNCAVVLVHHTGKAAITAGEANASRGSSAISNAARVNMTVFPMTKEEAAGFDLEEADRHKYIRVDDAKANYGILSGTARWFSKIEVNLGNHDDPAMGDRVGILAPWTPPTTFDGISVEAINKCLDAIEVGVVNEEGNPIGAYYSAGNKAADRHVKHVIALVLSVSEDKSKAILAAWMNSGLLHLSTYWDEKQRKDRQCVRVDNAKRPRSEGVDF